MRAKIQLQALLGNLTRPLNKVLANSQIEASSGVEVRVTGHLHNFILFQSVPQPSSDTGSAEIMKFPIINASFFENGIEMLIEV